MNLDLDWPFNCYPPSGIIDPIILDPVARAERMTEEDSRGLLFLGGTNIKHPGVYAFFVDYRPDNEPEIWYVGKAINIRNRLREHWFGVVPGGGFLRKAQEDGRIFVPLVAIWWTDRREEMEQQLIQQLRPIYNDHNAPPCVNSPSGASCGREHQAEERRLLLGRARPGLQVSCLT